jgi:diaminohydroxyphosphoribosylaminopyrimidine deaminase/5-amino-6-(5-phosphoribosylamino)uracil reductase
LPSYIRQLYLRTSPSMLDSPPINSAFMDRALSLAALGMRTALPNPCVGSVIEYRGQIIGEGYHKSFGGPHAEVNAIQSVEDRSKLPSATLYVTLEPCSHFGKTPPCADLLIQSGIKRVVVGCRDPFPAVAGRGIQKLLDAGVEVIEDIRHDECVLLNKRFIISHTSKRPYIILKWAQTEDGFLAPESGARTQISSPPSNLLVHHWRGQEMAIAVGTKTARIDNPLLTVRHTELFLPHELPAQNPTRVVLGEGSQLPPDLSLFKAPGETIIFSSDRRFAKKEIQAVTIYPISANAPLLTQACQALYERSLLSLFVEGGAHTLRRFIEADLWDEARVFVAPKQFGKGTAAPRLVCAPRSVVESGSDQLLIYHHPDLPKRLGLRE